MDYLMDSSLAFVFLYGWVFFPISVSFAFFLNFGLSYYAYLLQQSQAILIIKKLGQIVSYNN